MITLECEQYSDEWWQARLGLPTASKFGAIVTTKGEPSKSSDKYLYQLATELVTGNSAGTSYQNAAMVRGHEIEAEARSLFEFSRDVEVKQVGLIYSDPLRLFGASPDGLLEDAGLEIYSPESPAAVYCLLNPEKAITHAKKFQQIQGSLFISGFDRWFFEMYYPGLPPLIQEVRRDEEFISKLEAELDKFVIELAMVTKKLKGML